MAKKKPSLQELMAFVDSDDRYAGPLAIKRFYGGKQLFNAKTHRLRQDIRDREQAMAILLLVNQLAKSFGATPFKFSADEKRLLKQIVGLGHKIDFEDVK